MPFHKATTYLKNVMVQKEIIPFTRYMGGVGRHAQAKVAGQRFGCRSPGRNYIQVSYTFRLYILLAIWSRRWTYLRALQARRLARLG